MIHYFTDDEKEPGNEIMAYYGQVGQDNFIIGLFMFHYFYLDYRSRLLNFLNSL